jgi:signal transduction histidine kinase
MPNSISTVQWQNNQRRFTIAIVPGIVTLIVVATTLASILNLRESRRWIEHTRQVQFASSELLTYMLEAESGVRGFVLSGDETFLAALPTARAKSGDQLQTLRRLTDDNPGQQQRIAELRQVTESRFAALDTAIAGRKRSGSPVLSTGLPKGEGVRRMEAVRAILNEIQHEESALLVARDARDKRNLQVSAIVIGIGGFIAVLVAFITNALLVRTASRLGQANADLQVQAFRLEEQATELETQASELEATAVELEASNVELEEQATELQEQRDSAHASRAEAEQANAAKSRFLSVMSHELRTPLNAIAGYVDIMDAGVHGPVTDDQREDIRRIKRAVAQLTSVINDILNFAKLEAGEVRFDIGRVAMQEALSNASSLMEPQAAAKGVRFRYEACDANVVAWADRERVQQVILNLLSNAVKYTHADGEVRLVCEMDDSKVYVRVFDTGRGIAPRDVKRIFDPFVQLIGTQHMPSEGVGLGLAISRDLARGMGGDIVVRSTLGEGSIFEFTLPAAALDPTTRPSRKHDDDERLEPAGV